MISIVLPVYNGKKFIDRMISSVLSQDYEDFELIVVDNNSSDGSYEWLLDTYKNNQKVKVLRQMKQGVSAARNLGIKNSSGDYLLFVDCDDSLPDNYLIKLLAGFEQKNTLLTYSDYELRGDAGREGMLISDGDREWKLNDYLARLFDVEFYQGYVWNKLFRADFIRQNNLCFDEDIYYNEDRLFIVRYLLAAAEGDGQKADSGSFKVVSTTETHYSYYLNTGGAFSLGEKHFPTKKEITEFTAYFRMKDLLEDYLSLKQSNQILDNLYRNMASRQFLMFNRMLSKRHPLKYFISPFRRYVRAFDQFDSYFDFEPEDKVTAVRIKKMKLYGRTGITFEINEY